MIVFQETQITLVRLEPWRPLSQHRHEKSLCVWQCKHARGAVYCVQKGGHDSKLGNRLAFFQDADIVRELPLRNLGVDASTLSIRLDPVFAAVTKYNRNGADFLGKASGVLFFDGPASPI